MAVSEAVKLARMQARENDKQRMFALLTNPAVVSLASLLTGLYVANHVRWDKDDARNTDVRAIAMAGTAIGSLAAMGLKDKWLLGGFGLAAGLSGLDPFSIPSVSSLTENFGLGSDARLFGASIPGVTPGHPLWEWATWPVGSLVDMARGKR